MSTKGTKIRACLCVCMCVRKQLIYQGVNMMHHHFFSFSDNSVSSLFPPVYPPSLFSNCQPKEEHTSSLATLLSLPSPPFSSFFSSSPFSLSGAQVPPRSSPPHRFPRPHCTVAFPSLYLWEGRWAWPGTLPDETLAAPAAGNAPAGQDGRAWRPPRPDHRCRHLHIGHHCWRSGAAVFPLDWKDRKWTHTLLLTKQGADYCVTISKGRYILDLKKKIVKCARLFELKFIKFPRCTEWRNLHCRKGKANIHFEITAVVCRVIK